MVPVKRQPKGTCRRCHVMQTHENSYWNTHRGFFQSYCKSCGRIVGDWFRADARAKKLEAWLRKYYEEKETRERIL
jgi:NMD protein affecting ribosome stability and mRNA decay